jgi:2-polyprenyl-6-methoxyphenol hydroxylase-like FAD-dependent oxidoreductase
LEVRADLVIGADGRQSTVRDRAGLKILELGAPIDVLWFRISKQPGDPEQTLGHVGRGHFAVTIDRDKYWQCGYVIPKGAAEEKRRHGLEAFREEVAVAVPFLRDRTAELKNWDDDIKLLTVKMDRLSQWYRPGLLCIGDSAHAMSPVGGVGINLAIQDAVAAANHLAMPLLQCRVDIADLEHVQHRREWPTRMTQGLQMFLHKNVLEPIFRDQGPRVPPWPLRILARWPILQRIPARLVGIGFRPEHVLPAPVEQH